MRKPRQQPSNRAQTPVWASDIMGLYDYAVELGAHLFLLRWGQQSLFPLKNITSFIIETCSMPLVMTILFYWSIVDLQCCANFCCTAKWLLYIYIYILFYILFHYGLSQNIEYSSLCYTVGLCCLSILYTIVCICYSQTPNPFLPHTPPLTTTSLFPMSVNMTTFLIWLISVNNINLIENINMCFSSWLYLINFFRLRKGPLLELKNPYFLWGCGGILL